MIDLAKVKPNILADIEENCKDPQFCSVEEAFDYWLNYQGIIGYTSQIMGVLKNLQEASYES